MFRGGGTNAYDDLVVKATDETQTSENWGVLIELCDAVVSDKSPSGPRDCIASVQRRLQHRSANVQLYCMTLAEALVKNCGEKVHKEIASRSFMNALAAIVQGRNTHDKVKKRVLQCLHSWAEDFKGNANLGLVEETEQDLQSKGYRYEEEPEPSTHPPDDVLKREEEELQRAIAESEREAEWRGMAGVGPYASTSAGASGSGSGPSTVGPGGYAPAAGRSGSAAVPGVGQGYGAGAGPGKSLPDPRTAAAQPPTEQFAQVNLHDTAHPQALAEEDQAPAGGADLYPMRTKGRPAPLRVKALYDFEPNEEGELGFKEGDIIKVLDSAYRDWWKGEAHGQTGIFPVNYVEPIPDPTPESLAREAEAEAAVFSQLSEIDRLLSLMHSLDAKRDNLADNDELSDLYQKTLMLRPKIVRLIEKYTQKKAELLAMNDKFMKAKKTYDLMIEESLAKYHPGVAAEQFTQPNPQYQQQYPHFSQYPAGYPQDQYAQGQHPPGAAADGIDTSRYYLAADGNWYAYTPEQLAANAHAHVHHQQQYSAAPAQQHQPQPATQGQQQGGYGQAPGPVAPGNAPPTVQIRQPTGDDYAGHPQQEPAGYPQAQSHQQDPSYPSQPYPPSQPQHQGSYPPPTSQAPSQPSVPQHQQQPGYQQAYGGYQPQDGSARQSWGPPAPQAVPGQ